MIGITFQTAEGRFNYRVCAVILHENKLLAMRDDRSPYFYLPGGRVHLHKTAEQAVIRELHEELGIEAELVSPLWLDQSFFIEDVNREKYHELCLYFLIDASKTSLMEKGLRFLGVEKEHRQLFEWLPFESLKDAYLYPLIIKEKIWALPDSLMLVTELA